MASIFASCLALCPEEGSKRKIKAPAQTKCEVYVCAIAKQYAVIGQEQVALALNRLKIPVCKPGSNTRQSAFHYGWTSGHYVTIVFVFSLDRRIVVTVVNAPGAMHNSMLTEKGLTYNKMEN